MPQVVRDIFENYVKETYSVDDCIAVNSGTSALIATLWSMDLGARKMRLLQLRLTSSLPVMLS